ncbi:MAG TPA: peptidase U32 family protein, partial [Verrucomicrobiae bacterium]|nr:peptidase U32 family protein [Verrucomicrobiae bacterium]
MKLPELLAPAGGMEALKAAVENGANAVYLGGSSFNARASAANFSREELKEAVEYAHLRGVKVYTTVNILIDNGEIPELVDYVHHLYSIGVDAVILQDLGVARLLRSILPEMPCHASTQMTLVNSPGVKFLQDLGFERVVLARETAVKDMELIYRATGAELEVFVHGALCICYSGQCLMSSMIGGRSGNRGRCAQPCRLTYDLVDLTTNTRQRAEVGEHLLSPKDLNLVDYLKELAEAGVSSL